MRRASIPNALTLLRLIVALAVFAALTPRPFGPITHGLAAHDRPWLLLAAFLFMLAAATDALDGHLARRWNVISRFGRVMDPFADKLLILGSFIALAGPAFTRDHASLSGITPWVCILILGRELLVTSLRGLLEGQGGDASAMPAGKAKMILQSAAIPAVLLLLALDPASPAPWVTRTNRGIVWATVAVTIASGWPYVARAIKPKGSTRA